MKPIGRKNYGSIPHLSNSKLGTGDHFINEGQERILTYKKRDKHDIVLVTEKYDGSNVGVAKVGGKIYSLTRSGYDASTSRFKQHHLFSEWVRWNYIKFDKVLSEGERLCGEWLLQAHGLEYSIKGDPFVVFDWMNSENERKLYDELFDLPFKVARLIHKGDAVSVASLMPELTKKTQDVKAKDCPEGVVYRVERRGRVDFLAKWVRSDFKPGIYCIGVDEKNLIWNTTLNCG